jgi:hypothetical protein
MLMVLPSGNSTVFLITFIFISNIIASIIQAKITINIDKSGIKP